MAANQWQCAALARRSLIGTHRLSLSALAISRQTYTLDMGEPATGFPSRIPCWLRLGTVEQQKGQASGTLDVAGVCSKQ
jgi:hypothetical protein